MRRDAWVLLGLEGEPADSNDAHRMPRWRCCARQALVKVTFECVRRLFGMSCDRVSAAA